ncbi:saccharopine dehydrogenase NADP-binding domain-containing protein [Streptomyces sp. NPDC056704]|uniref:saccharopine dehydrogenase NADP-binding domain-containing protein n=1 Tax=Streptomyces sp. NPDC056704 TaxID=3345917 RepID=UPI0036A1E1BF
MTERTKIMVVGAGHIGTGVCHALAQTPRPLDIVLAGRDEDRLTRVVNTARFGALARGGTSTVNSVRIDLDDVDHAAEQIAGQRPDIIFAAASVQSWWELFTLPKDRFEPLYEAAYGPWLPFHLAPVVKLMKAVRAAGSQALVVNAAYPDAVHPLLADQGLSPDVGIGNVANNVPAVRTIAADLLGADPAEVVVRFVAHHYVSHRISRVGDSGGAPFHLTVWLRGERVDLAPEAMFAPLLTTHRRLGGLPGQAMTVASAISVLEPLATGATALAHAPGPHGLVGGYPVRLDSGAIALDLDPAMDLETAQEINRVGQRHDGIATIDDGWVTFEERSAAVLREHLGYDCSKLHWSEAADHATELRHKYIEYQNRA